MNHPLPPQFGAAAAEYRRESELRAPPPRNDLPKAEPPEVSRQPAERRKGEPAQSLRQTEPTTTSGEVVKVKGVAKILTTVAGLNERFALFEPDGGASTYISRRDFHPIAEPDLKRRLENEVVATGKDLDGGSIFTKAFLVFTQNAGRHVYRRAVFTNRAATPDEINLYRGLGVIPRAGNCERIKQHIREVICSGNEPVYSSMMSLLAWQLQNAGKPSRVITVLKSRQQQTGKGVFLGELMSKIWGSSGFQPASLDQVLGRFNSALRGRGFIYLDEVLFAGDRRASDGLKSLSTTSEIGIEEKGLPIVKCPAGINLWLASNHDAAAHIEELDERYWVLDVSPHRVGDHNYFAALIAEIENGGREAFAHHLLSLDVSGFVPARDVPKKNAAHAAMVQQSINPYDARNWIDQCARTGQIIGLKDPDRGSWRSWHAGEKFTVSDLWNAYVEWQKTVRSPVGPKPTHNGSFGEVLGKAGLEARKSDGVRLRIVPSAEHALGAVWSDLK